MLLIGIRIFSESPFLKIDLVTPILKDNFYMQDPYIDIESTFVSFDLGLELRKIGFKPPCLGFYTREKKFYFIQGISMSDGRHQEMICIAPLYTQVTDWLRLDHKLHLVVLPEKDEVGHVLFFCYAIDTETLKRVSISPAYQETWQALREGIFTCIKKML